MPDANGWDVPFDTADILTVDVYGDGSADFTLTNVDGELGVWQFEGFPGEDFMDAGLNIVGPWLNARGLAYTSWQEPQKNQHIAVVYVYTGPEVDPRIIARRR